MKNRRKAAGQIIQNLFFPKRCRHCGRVIGFLPVCIDCNQEEARLRLSQKKIVLTEENQTFLEQIYAVYSYESIVRTAVLRFKFTPEPFYADLFAEKMASLLAEKDYDGIIPVPQTRAGLRRHKGCHSARLLAKAIARNLALPLWDDVLCKQYDTPLQHQVSLIHRQGNLAGSMAIKKPEKIEGKQILLVDDIVTTGNTLQYCAKLCCAYGAAGVEAVCYAATPKKQDAEQSRRE